MQRIGMKSFNNYILFAIGLLFFLGGTTVSGQGWERTYGQNNNFSDEGTRVFETPDGGFLVAGRGLSKLIFFLKVDQEGDIVWSRGQLDWYFGASGRMYDMIEIDDGYVVGGVISKNNIGEALVMKIDMDGDTLWTRTFQDDSVSIRIASLIETQNKDIFVVGWKNNPPNISNGASDVFLARMDKDGELIYEKVFGEPNQYEKIESCIETSDGSILLWGHVTAAGVGPDVYVVDVSTAGDTLWTKRFGNPVSWSHESGKSIVASPDGHYFGLFQNSTLENVGLMKMDENGNELITYNLGNTDDFIEVNELKIDDEGLSINGSYQENGTLPWNGFHFRVSLEGDSLWLKRYGGQLHNNLYDITSTSDGGYILVGIISKAIGLSTFNDLYLVKTDSLGNSWTNYHQGNVFHDSLTNCLQDGAEISLSGWPVTAQGDNGTFYGITDSIGNYEIRTDTGTYELSINVPNAYWTACRTDSIVSMPTFFDTVQVDFPAQAQYECPIINVDVSTPYLRRCFPNTYYVSYCNEGTVLEEEPFIEIEFDEWLTVDSSSLSWSSQDGQVFTFEIGQLDVGECGGFQVYTTLNCDSTVLGQTHCVMAHSFPDSVCLPPNTFWDGSTIAVDGECDSDSLFFKIRNTGTGNMSQPLNFVIIEDQVLHLNGSFMLPAGDSTGINIGTTGMTYRLEAEQAPDHPTNSTPSVTIEGCGNGMQFSLGFVNMYSHNDADPFISIDCQDNRGSFDPNDKQAFPNGIGTEHIIFHDTELEYMIRFQNTGTDTAFKVVIRDTLSPFLDPVSVRPGASSHPYTWTLQNTGALKFTFDDIMLPDSNVNEMLSHGFVKFKIKQQPGNLPGTLIHNQAAIYFDFNAPVITNQTDHKIDDRPMVSDTLTLVICETADFPQDTTLVIPSNQLSWEINSTNNLVILPIYNLVINDSILLGEIYDTTFYDADTTIIQQYISENGCDSIVTIHLDVITSTDNIQAAANQFKLFPNPTSGQVNISFEMKKAGEVEMVLRENSGRQVGILSKKQWLGAGKHHIPIPIYDLPNGFYWLEVKSNNWTAVLKLSKI